MASELLRVVAVDGTLLLDTRRRLAGRGAWIHPDLVCLDTAERRRAFPRALRVPGPLDAEGLRAQVAHSSGSTGSSRVMPERRKQVDPS